MESRNGRIGNRSRWIGIGEITGICYHVTSHVPIGSIDGSVLFTNGTKYVVRRVVVDIYVCVCVCMGGDCTGEVAVWRYLDMYLCT